MLSLILAAFLSIPANVAAPVQAPSCETYAPNAYGVAVTVCSGHVVNACDGSGHCTADDK